MLVCDVLNILIANYKIKTQECNPDYIKRCILKGFIIVFVPNALLACGPTPNVNKTLS